MAGDSKEKKWVVFSFAILFGFSVSVVGQGTRTSVEAHDHAVEIQHSGSKVEEMGHEPGSVQSERTPAPAGPLSGARGDAGGGEQKDLTAFFVIGFIINILLIGAFMFWAVGQWRKTK